MATAIREDNPVIITEHKLHYLANPSPVPEGAYTIPLGRARIRRPGTDATVVATLVMVERALQAAELLERDEGISVEVIDPRSTRPLAAVRNPG